MKKIIFFIFLVNVIFDSHATSPSSSYIEHDKVYANFQESNYLKLRSLVFKKEHFEIESSRVVFCNFWDCKKLFCSNVVDCDGDVREQTEHGKRGNAYFYFSATDYNSFVEFGDAVKEIENKKEYSKLMYNYVNHYDYFSLENKACRERKKERIKQGINYFIKNKKKFTTSTWLKSIGCRSMNLLNLMQDLDSNKNVLKSGIIFKVGEKVFLKGTIKNRPFEIELDVKSNEMRYLTDNYYNEKLELYTVEPLIASTNKPITINFCESYILLDEDEGFSSCDGDPAEIQVERR